MTDPRTRPPLPGAPRLELSPEDVHLDGDDKGKRGVPSYWLGRYGDAEARAIAAMNVLERGTTGWYAAVGHVAMAAGQRGDGARLR